MRARDGDPDRKTGEASFQNRTTVSGFRRDDRGATIYREVLGPAFESLPPAVRTLHEGSVTRRWTGSATVRRGTGIVARLVCAAARFPESADGVPVTITFAPEEGRERWTRTFGGKTLTSFQSAGTGRDRHLLIERFGIASFSLALVRDGTRLLFMPRRWSVGKVPMPGWLLPTGESFETEIDGRFVFDITIRTPLAGLIVAYRGTLEPEATDPTPV